MLGLFPPMTSNALWENSGQKLKVLNQPPPSFFLPPPLSHKGIQIVGGCDPVDQKTNLVRDIKKCVHDQTSPPDDHSAWKKKTQLAFDPEREKAKLQLSQN